MRGAACAGSGYRCSSDSDCCAALSCGPGNLCRPGCRIDQVFQSSGTRNPANACQACQPARSRSSWTNLTDGTPCDDRNACTTRDLCRSGACSGGPASSCADTNPCTIDACDPAVGCVHRPLACDDANACTSDSCNPATGRCEFRSGSAACDDRNPCTSDGCDPGTGCTHVPLAGACDDRNACTTADVCEAGRCVGGAAPDCNDGDPWTRDSCDAHSGCVHKEPAPQWSPAAAFLFFPEVVASGAAGATIETRIQLSNGGAVPILAHVSFLDGDASDPRYCYECDFDLPLSARATDVLVVSRSGAFTTLRSRGSGSSRSCAHASGFVTVDVEDLSHRASTANVLSGYEVVVDYGANRAFTLPALALHGGSGNGDRAFAFDGVEYARFPGALQTTFVAPDRQGPRGAELILLTPAFARQSPPHSDCSVIGSNQAGEQFSNSFQFGCFTRIRLQDIDPQLERENLGSDRGTLSLRCTVYGTGTNGTVQGAVHGVLLQTDALGNAWGSLLGPSGGDGGPATLRLADPAR